MNQSVQINDLPDDILLHIQKQQTIPEIQLPTNPESTYLNRYTPSAKALRCVCRRWKELVDLRSNYHARITTAVIQLQTSREDSHCHGRETFRTHLEQSRSLLAVLFVAIHKGRPRDPEILSNRTVNECAIEIHRLVGYGGRLIQLEADFGSWQFDALTQHLFTAVLSLGSHAMLQVVHLTIKCGGSNFFIEHAKSASKDSWPALEKMLGHVPSIRKLQIIDSGGWMPQMEGIRRIRLRLPQTLTSLFLLAEVRCFRELFASCTGLTHLKLYLRGNIFDESQHRDQIEMNSLVSLQLEGYAIGVTNIFNLLRCNSVERVILDLLDYPNGDGSYDNLEGSGLHNSTSFPSLKNLVVRSCLLPAISTLAAISIPDYHILQLLRITVRDHFSPRDVIPGTLPDLMGRMPAHRFEISAEGPTCAALLKTYPHSDAVRHLRVTINPREDSLDLQVLDEGLKLSYTRLLSLSIVAEDVLHRQEFNSYLDSADAAELMSEVVYFGGVDGSDWNLGQLGVIEDLRLAPPVGSTSTFILCRPFSYDPASDKFTLKSISALLNLCQHARTLVVKYVKNYYYDMLAIPEDTYLFERGWNSGTISEDIGKRNGIRDLDEINPHDTSGMDNIILVEYPPLYVTIDDLERLRPVFEEKLPAIQASRDWPLKSVILRSFSVWDIPEVRDFPQDCGVLLRLEAVRPSEIEEFP
jgi:hypothetical protein